MLLVRGRAAALLLALSASATGCGDNRGGAPSCTSDGDCPDGELCLSGAVHEVELEPGDQATCRAASEAIGSAPPTWSWEPGGRSLADRLCVAMRQDDATGPDADARRARQLELLAALGVRTIRIVLTWSVIEPVKGTFDFSAFDPRIQAAAAAGLDVIGVLAYGTPWATTATTTDDRFPPDDPADYATYAREVATHFAGEIRRYELWNEPNDGARFFRPDPNGDAARYAELMKAGAGAVHQVCADCTVSSAGMSFAVPGVNGAVELVHDMLAADGHAFDAVDAVGLHPYPVAPPSVGPELDGGGQRALSGMLDDLRAVFALHAAAPPPVAITDIGWPTYGTVDETKQAAFLAREVLLGASLGTDPLCWFTLADGPSFGTSSPEDDFGLFRYGSEDPAQTPSTKLAGDAMAWLARVGEGAVPAGASADPSLHDPAAGRFALEFDAPGRRWTALWRLDAPAAVHLPGETRHAYDITGNQIATPSGGALDIEVGEVPVYLVPSP